MTEHLIYVDGGCYPNPGIGSWCFIKLSEFNNVIGLGSGVELVSTNNRSELLAIINAIESLEVTDCAIIHSDSQLSVNTFNLWMERWERNNWRKVKNADLVQRLLSLKRSHKNVSVVWVKSHCGNLWNETADLICNIEIDLAIKNNLKSDII